MHLKYSKWESISAYLVENIKNRIESGEFKTGHKIPSEKVLSEQYSVGRSSVREALKMLQAENVIEIVKGKGSFVLSDEISSQVINIWYRSKTETLSDLIEIRAMLECLAIRKATSKITDDIISQLVYINHEYEETHSANISAMLQYDESFHRVIIKTAGIELLDELYKRVETAYTEYRIKGFVFTKYFKQAAEGHRRIVDSLKLRDADIAEKAMREHIYEVVKHIEKILNISEA